MVIAGILLSIGNDLASAERGLLGGRYQTGVCVRPGKVSWADAYELRSLGAQPCGPDGKVGMGAIAAGLTQKLKRMFFVID